MSVLRLWRRITAVVFIVIAAVVMVAAQTTVSNPSTSTASSPDKLLAELRGLRADLQQVATISVRTQLLVARLQLQEQRINVVAGQVAEVRRLIGIKQSGQIPLADKLKRFENTSRGAGITSQEEREIEQFIPMWKSQLGQMQKEEQQLRLQEMDLSNQFATEQGQWMDFNSRLDELERQLPVPRR
jgi:hypothetical protein